MFPVQKCASTRIAGSAACRRLAPIRTLGYYSLMFLSLNCCIVYGQQADSSVSQLSIDLELRPRVEYYGHYRLAGLDSVTQQVRTTQRNRLTVHYAYRGFTLHGSLQEIHVWGSRDNFSKVAHVNAFELYAAAKWGKGFSAKLGRQALSLDNGRLFSAAPWAQQSRAHEGVRLFYQRKINADLTVAFTRPYTKSFDSDYSPVASHRYKWLLMQHFKAPLSNTLTLTSLQVADAFNVGDLTKNYQWRFTNGGRIEWSKNGYYATLAGYYQWGNTDLQKKINAWYLQPEISAKFKNNTIRVGAELLSGDDPARGPSSYGRSFVPLYGVAWKFMGNMNFFTRFPADVNNRGLINPYVFFLQQLHPSLLVRADAHLFYSQYAATAINNSYGKKYLGFEADLSLQYKPMKTLEINFGFSFMAPGKAMYHLDKITHANSKPLWSYLSVSYAPNLYRYKK